MKKILFFFTLCLLSWTVSAQTNPIKGVVLSSVDEEPLIGVSVLVKGTTNGAATDVNGEFSLNVRPSDVLVISYVGYVSQEIAVGNTRDFRIILYEDQQALDEVVVIGYGVQKKSLVSGAIGKVTETDIEKTMPTRLEDVLNGKVAGLTVMQQSGQPGSGSDMYIRGIGTVNNSGPLYVVDGMQIEGNINYLNPKDIASVEVLKDAASAAIYGTRGANGVILITTKQGVKGSRVVNYDFSYGWQNPWKKKEVLNAQEYMTLMNEMQVNDGGQIRFTASDIANAKTTDWQDEVFNYDAPIVNHNISLMGASENNSYSLSFGYLKQDGIVGGNYGKSNLERYNLRINDQQTAFQTNTRSFLNKLKVGVNLGYTHGNNTSVDTNSEFGSILGSALVFAPYLPVYATDPEATLASYPNAVRDKNGNVFTIPQASDKYQEIGNPVAMLNNTAQYQVNEEDVFVGGVWGELDIWKNIKFRTSYMIDMSFWGNNGYNMPYYIAPQGKFIDDLEHANIYGEKNKRFSWQVENYISWNEIFNNKHNVEVMAGQSALKTTQSQIGGSRGMPLFDEHILLMNMNNTLADKTYYNVYGYFNNVGDNANFYALASYFGRLNYNFDERYIFSASLRRDGSSRFGPDRKWGLFPAVSVAWNILNEPYIANKPAWLNAAKLRGSWGRNGNDRIGNLRYMTVYARGGAYDYYFGGGFDPETNTWSAQRVSGLQPGAIENRLLGWEESEQTNIGLDLYLLRSAFNFSLDWFKKTTIGMLQTKIIAPSDGQGAPIANAGNMSNRGVEINAGYKGHAGNFNFFADVNATYVKTILDKYDNATGIQTNIENQGNTGVGEYMRGQTGEVYPFFFGYKTNGLFQTWDEVNSYTYTVVDKETGEETIQLIQPNAHPGDIRFVDTNNDGQITAVDKVKIGKPMPDWQLGVTLGGDWRGFDFNLFFKTALGFQIFDYAQRGDVTALNRPAWILQRWHGEDTSNTIPRMTAQNPNGNYASSDLYLKDGSYLRLKTAQIGYTVPVQWTQKVAIQKFRVYVAGYNLLTITGYDGFDVEMGNHSVDRGIYPQSRTIAVGATVTF
ncbi:MAG: TonB-dependent receptor [Dysgonamonadaceae bacterium]|jgi:TonB-linked SusC/RagA family outer membrane protein|nr:TonB-dependent receptor [Dysgonamonadaceae bacterium]